MVDAYFSKLPFIQTMKQAGFEVVTRLRRDARLRYIYKGPCRKGRGRPRKFDGRLDVYNLRMDQVRPCAQAEDGSWIAYELIANVQAWKREAKLVIVHDLKADGSIKRVRIIACTDLKMDAGNILLAYHSRFQIELLYRDAKQHVGLTHCQARSTQKMHFHLNASLTTVSVARIVHHLNDQNEREKPFSLADIKTQYANDLMLDRLFPRLESTRTCQKLNLSATSLGTSAKLPPNLYRTIESVLSVFLISVESVPVIVQLTRFG